MQCQRCGAENPDGSAFCNSCGAGLNDQGAAYAGGSLGSGKVDIMAKAKLLIAGGVLFVALFIAAIIFSLANSAYGTVVWLSMMVLLLALTLMTTRSMKALRFVAPLMIFLAIIAAATDMGANTVFNRLSAPIACDDDARLRVEERVQHPYAGKVVTEYVFFCQLEGNEWRVSPARIIAAHSIIYGGFALLLLGVYAVIAIASRPRAGRPGGHP